MSNNNNNNNNNNNTVIPCVSGYISKQLLASFPLRYIKESVSSVILFPHAHKGLCPFFRLLGFEFLLIGGAVCYLCSRTGSPP